MSESIRIIQVGLGPIGRRMIHRIATHPRLQLVGAVDIDASLHGRDAGELANLDQPLGVNVVGDLDAVGDDADVASVMTTSALDKCEPTLIACCEAALHVVSTCEELSYPWQTAAALARRIDDAAQATGVAVLGTGVNPGFLMDLLPLVLTGVCENVEAIRVERYQDAGQRRLPFQLKVGATLSPEQFQQKVDAGQIRHVGLTESMHMLAARLGWTLDRTRDQVNPLINHERIEGHALTIEPGQVKGVHQVGEGWIGDRRVIELIFHAEVGQARPQDRVIIRGNPGFESIIPGGIHGDTATTAMAINCIPLLQAARPGLRTMADLAPPSCFE